MEQSLYSAEDAFLGVVSLIFQCVVVEKFLDFFWNREEGVFVLCVYLCIFLYCGFSFGDSRLW